MAQYRQSGFNRFENGGVSDHISLGIRSAPPIKQSRSHHNHRRFKSSRKISIGAIVLMLAIAFVVSVLTFFYITRDKGPSHLCIQISYKNLDTFKAFSVTSLWKALKGKPFQSYVIVVKYFPPFIVEIFWLRHCIDPILLIFSNLMPSCLFAVSKL